MADPQGYFGAAVWRGRAHHSLCPAGAASAWPQPMEQLGILAVSAFQGYWRLKPPHGVWGVFFEKRISVINSLKILLAASAVFSVAVVAIGPASAKSGVSFRAGNVAVGYSDGYYDRSNRWHAWRNARERAWYRSHYRVSYRDYRRDQDRDGIPDRVDRDRDGDGVPNYRDRSPNNPWVGAVGYSDGYYDRSNRWHAWRDAGEHAWYRSNYRDSYRDYRRDQDRDGIPDRMDRDRDGDGVPNYRDRSPNNPWVGAVGYSDGYYDRSNTWHAWRDAGEHAWYRSNYRDSYRDYRRADNPQR
jgi:hypothetical protein